ncbi:MAG: NnrS family protein [Nitrospinae bacterium]|nr:NnrS family protein [Nitrospinota bacterium]MBL7020599.1 NnrS family protein [Nitrospinaceae bacterium]
MSEPSRDIIDHPVLGYGFRPFFILGALYSIISLLIWGGFYARYVTPPLFMIDPVSWHAHEMIYGFTMAIVAGFLLTAVANWTDSVPVRKFHLLGLCLLWLAGRVVMNFDLGFSEVAVLVFEGAFILTLALSLSMPLFKTWDKRNFVFLLLLSILFACDMVFLISKERASLYVAVMVIITMISLIGGRIIPAFTVDALQERGEEAHETPQGKLDVLAILSLVLVILSLVFVKQEETILAGAAFLSTIIHALRLRRYHTHRILDDPMVWILHVGYSWVILGLFFIGVSALGFLPFSIALHAFTVGAIGSMTLGMMCRVTLGHTGRNRVATNLTKLSFLLLQCAAFVRVFGLMIAPDYSIEWIIGSATLWALCFALYILIYAPMLWRPDLDERVA